MQHLKPFSYFKNLMKNEKLSHVLSHESDIFHMTNSINQDFNNIGDKEVRDVGVKAIENFHEKTNNVFDKINVSIDSSISDMCIFNKGELKVNAELVINTSKNLSVPISVVLDTSIYYELSKLVILYDAENNFDILDFSDGEDVWREKFAYTLYQLDRLPTDAEELFSVKEAERGQLPLFYYNGGGMYGRSSMGNVGVTVHKDKKDYTPYDRLTVYSDNDNNMYTDDEVNALYTKYTTYCNINNITPLSRVDMTKPEYLSEVIEICK